MNTKVLRSFTIEATAGGGTGEDQSYDLPSVLAFQIENVGANPLDSLILQVKNGPTADWFDFATDAELIAPASGFYYQNPSATVIHNLAAGAKVQYAIRLLAGHSVRFKAICAAGTTLEFNGLVQEQQG